MMEACQINIWQVKHHRYILTVAPLRSHLLTNSVYNLTEVSNSGYFISVILKSKSKIIDMAWYEDGHKLISSSRHNFNMA